MTGNRRPQNINTPHAFRRAVESLAMQAYDKPSIANQMKSTTQYLINREVAATDADIEYFVNQFCDEFAPYNRIQSVLQSKLIMPNNRKDWFLYDELIKRVTPIKQDILKQDFTNKQDYLRNSLAIPVVYTPKRPTGIYEERGLQLFNKYRLPFWKEEIEGKGLSYPIVKLPEIYTRFLTHFTDNDQPSIDYILDWAAYSINGGPKNKTFLTAIGAQGIGKGVLAKIFTRLHGEDNSADLLFKSIGKQFNKQFGERTFTYLDEVKKATEDEINKLKKLEGDIQEIEQKGIESELVENHNNIYIASNNLDALRLDADDRRHGIVNIGSTRLERVFTQAEIHSLYENDDNIRQLGYFLMTRVPNPVNFTQGYKSQNALRILNNSSYDWERYIIDEFSKEFANKIISCRSASEYIGIKFPKQRYGISVNSLESLSKKFHGVFEVLKTKLYSEFEGNGNLKEVSDKNEKRVSCMKIYKLNEQKQHDTLEVESED